MTQNAVVKKVLQNGTAEVLVLRGSACGGNCAHCGACSYNNRITTTARNTILASEGDRVIIKSSTADVIGAAALVYLLPLVTFFAGYLLAAAFSAGEGIAILVSLGGLAFGLLLVVLITRHRKVGEKITFEIIDFDRTEN